MNAQTPRSYRTTFFACGAAYVSQAAVVNLTPVLFLPLHEQYGFSYAQLGTLVLINFFTQLVFDVGCSPLIDRWGFRVFAVVGHACTVLGFMLFAFSPWLPISPYSGFAAGTFVFSMGGGLLELIVSPIVNALPAKNKSAAMSLMHSFYCWGQLSVALLTTLFLYVFGKNAWPYAFLLWMLLPLANLFVFLRCPLAEAVPAEHRSHATSIMRNPRFVLLLLVILCAGASEITLSQWASAFLEDVMALPKVVGDIAGVCMFAIMMGIARTVNGIRPLASHAAQSTDAPRSFSLLRSVKNAGLRQWMCAGAALSFVCYLIVATTNAPIAALAACALCGLGVSLLWPGALSLSAEAFPLAGSWMMAILAAGGDTGASLGPWLAGLIADHTGLRVSLLSTSVFPLTVVVCLWVLGRIERRRTTPGSPS